jgi:hypothetical protein
MSQNALFYFIAIKRHHLQASHFSEPEVPLIPADEVVPESGGESAMVRPCFWDPAKGTLLAIVKSTKPESRKDAAFDFLRYAPRSFGTP